MTDKDNNTGPLRKYVMWYEVHRLRQNGLNKSQIGKELGIDRGTVRYYLRMTEEVFLQSESYQRKYALKLNKWEEFIVDRLNKFPFLSAAQVEDQLKERYGNDLGVCSKTIFNFVARMREKHNLPKRPEDNKRPYEMQPEMPYGEFAQVDFGEKYMSRDGGSPVKVYFFAMVLCRSRHKFLYFSLKPFTTATAIYAHELAFEFYGGMPLKLIYDNDKVFIKDSYLGDILLTNGFRTFVNEQHFECIFCRKSDPESKGKVENVVKYVKHNYLSGRYFTDIDKLNQDALAWLERTGNGIIHGSTRLIPAEVFKQECKHLQTYYGTPTPPVTKVEERMVRKDNVVNYKCCYYTVPTGTYQGPSSCVHIEEKEGLLIIYSKETGKVIAEHAISTEKGKLIRNTSHQRDRTSTYAQLEEKIREYMGASDALDIYLATLHRDKSRYYRDILQYIIRNMELLAPQTLTEAMAKCMASNAYHAPTWIETAQTMQKKKGERPYAEFKIESIEAAISGNYNGLDMKPAQSNISTYQNIFNGQ